MDLKKFRKKQERLRERDLIRQCIILRKVPGILTFKTAFDLNNAVLKLTVAGIRHSNPKISEKALLEKLREIYGRQLNAND